ncbi:hypothetical protein pb186bvf_006509 [Paramecium bursaria]
MKFIYQLKELINKGAKGEIYLAYTNQYKNEVYEDHTYIQSCQSPIYLFKTNLNDKVQVEVKLSHYFKILINRDIPFAELIEYFNNLLGFVLISSFNLEKYQIFRVKNESYEQIQIKQIYWPISNYLIGYDKLIITQ